jgi:ribonuclease P protein component
MPKTHGLLGFRPHRTRVTARSGRPAAAKTRVFPHFFPQLWKTSGGDPTVRAGDVSVSYAANPDKARPFRPKVAAYPSPRFVDTGRHGSLEFGFLRFQRSTDRGPFDHEAYVSAKSASASQDSRLPRADEHEKGTPGAEAPPRQGTKASHGVFVLTSPRVTTSPRAQRFDKGRRLRQRGEFQKVFDKGIRTRGRFLTILVAPAQTNRSRLGIVASKKVGDAVRRNKAKRLIRELFRRNQNSLPEIRVDMVVIPRAEVFTAAFTTLEEDYRSVVARCLPRLGKAR